VDEDDPELAQAALKIQAVQRGKKDRLEVEQIRREKDDKLKVQKHEEASAAAAAQSSQATTDAEDPELAQAAVKIQAVQRGKKKRQELEQKRNEKEAPRPKYAASARQSGQLAPDDEDPELTQAAVKIQAVQRGKKKRKEVEQLRRGNEEARTAPASQNHQSIADEEDPELTQAAVKIQAVQRGKKKRKEVEQIRREKDGALAPKQGGVGHTSVVPSSSGHEREERLQYGASQCFEAEEDAGSRPNTGHLQYGASQCFEDDEDEAAVVAKRAGIAGSESPLALSEGNAEDEDDAGIYDDEGFEATEQLSDDFEDESTTKDAASPNPIATTTTQAGPKAVDEEDEDNYEDDDEYEDVDFEDDAEANVELDDDEPEIKYSYQDDSDEELLPSPPTSAPTEVSKQTATTASSKAAPSKASAKGLDMGDYDEFDDNIFEDDSEGDDICD